MDRADPEHIIRTAWPKADLSRIEGSSISWLDDQDRTPCFTYTFPFDADAQQVTPQSLGKLLRLADRVTDHQDDGMTVWHGQTATTVCWETPEPAPHGTPLNPEALADWNCDVRIQLALAGAEWQTLRMLGRSSDLAISIPSLIRDGGQLAAVEQDVRLVLASGLQARLTPVREIL